MSNEGTPSVSGEHSFRGDTPRNELTLEAFLSSEDTRFALSLAKEVVKAPGGQYNPLFLSGPSGSGKTHLLHAIANAALQGTQEQVVFLTTGKKFNEDLITALESQKVKEFRESHRKVTYLLLDDVEILAGRSKAQEELFHTFNALYDSSKQIVITSRVAPQDLELEERLTSRFVMGIVADLTPPSAEVVRQGLEKTAAQQKFAVSSDIYELLTEQLDLPYRELIACFKKILGYAALMERDVTMDMVEQVLSQLKLEIKKAPAASPPDVRQNQAPSPQTSQPSPSPLDVAKQTREKIVALVKEVDVDKDVVKDILLTIRGRFSDMEKSLNAGQDSEVHRLSSEIDGLCERAMRRCQERGRVSEALARVESVLAEAKKFKADKQFPEELAAIVREVSAVKEKLSRGDVEAAMEGADACLKVAMALPPRCLDVTRRRVSEILQEARKGEQASLGSVQFNEADSLLIASNDLESRGEFSAAFEALGKAWNNIREGKQIQEEGFERSQRQKRIEELTTRCTIVNVAVGKISESGAEGEDPSRFKRVLTLAEALSGALRKENVEEMERALKEVEPEILFFEEAMVRGVKTGGETLPASSPSEVPPSEGGGQGDLPRGDLIDELTARYRPNPQQTFASFPRSGSDEDAVARLKEMASSKSGVLMILAGQEDRARIHLIHALANEVARTEPGARVLVLSVDDLPEIFALAQRRSSSESDGLPQILLDARVVGIDGLHRLALSDERAQEFLMLLTFYISEKSCILVLSSESPSSELGGLGDGLKASLELAEVLDLRPH